MVKKLDKWVWISIILAVLLVSSLVYFGIKSYKTTMESAKNDAYLQGAQEGSQAAVLQLMQSGANCQPVNVYANNVTMQFVDVSCLQSASATTAAAK